MKYVGVEPIGFAEVRKEVTEPFTVTVFPEFNGDFVADERYVGVLGTNFEIIDCLGDWCQVRRAGCTDRNQGFATSSDLLIYLFDDLIAKAELTPKETGTYVVGSDILEGLYSFDLGEDEAGEVKASQVILFPTKPRDKERKVWHNERGGDRSEKTYNNRSGI